MKKIILSYILFNALLSNAQWTQVGNSINGQAAGDNCGWSTAISADGTIVATGAIFNGGATGQVRVFGLSDGIWAQIGTELNGETGGDQTGQSVALSDDGSVVAIGEPFNNDLGFTSGQVRVFRNINNTWTQVGQDLYGQNAIASAGTSVDLSADGNTVAFGAPNTQVGGSTFLAGNVEVYQLEGNSWVQKGGDINGDGSIIKFGANVSLSSDGNTIAIGQTGDPANLSTPQIGRVKVYQFINNQWTQIGNTIFGQVDRDEFGLRVSLSASGTILAISAPTSNVVVVYQLNGGAWTQVGDAIFGENPGDRFGSSISLSNDGSVLGIGARWNGTDGFRRGRAYVFQNQGGNWTQINNAMLGFADNDQFGFSIAISEDGSKVAFGAVNNDENGSNAGQVSVFENNLLSTSDFDSNSFSFYPNPAKDVVNFSSTTTIENIAFYNVLGQEVLIKQINSKEITVDVSSLVSGTYIVKLNGNTQNIKLIKL
uniref:T9SS type A sorting domain-containing protein n=1 Tax=Flavobacterium sp. TaxID=239 RepID=UPI00404B3ADD